MFSREEEIWYIVIMLTTQNRRSQEVLKKPAKQERSALRAAQQGAILCAKSNNPAVCVRCGGAGSLCPSMYRPCKRSTLEQALWTRGLLPKLLRPGQSLKDIRVTGLWEDGG